MKQPDRRPEAEHRGSAPSVSTPLLFLVLLSVVAAFSVVPILVSPSEHRFGPWLAALIPLPVLFGWWFWARHRQHPQRMFVIGLAFAAMQCFSVVGQIFVLGEAYRRTIGFMWLNLGVAGLAFIGGVIYLWVQTRRGRRD
ncbi:hypothetical protein [Deinococcus aerophilus]|uniref:Integral membrane protein n=1 Tax=Deinococcus aerophilus TaxID=522488 RepID=A0ABQ2GNU7_9DEIO|nr:hypothetical protein [Deinococcus aerophilus]GGM04641.1 hypothetical protein GCM10010841_11300 [Deinococcus aerophilus]